MYEQLGYSVYRRVIKYYTGATAEDAFGTGNCVFCCSVYITEICDRYEKSIAKGREKGKYNTFTASGVSGGFGVVIENSFWADVAFVSSACVNNIDDRQTKLIGMSKFQSALNTQVNKCKRRPVGKKI